MGAGELDAVDDSVDPEKLASEEKAEEVAYQEEVWALEAELEEAQKQYDSAVVTGNSEDADNLAEKIEALKDKLEDLHRSQGPE